jgi:hypothetical protein
VQALALAGRTVRGRQRLARERWLDSERRRRWLRTQVAAPAAAVVGRQLVHCFGDSHAVVFREIARRGMLPHTSFDIAIVAGATALGLANPNSQTRALPQFEHVIQRLPRARPLLFMLGEVDCGFVIWWRAQTKRVKPRAELKRSLRNYVAFLERLLGDGRRRLLVAAAPPPTILDGQHWGEIANLRREVTASLTERTELTFEYNARLRDWTRREGCSFLDYEADIVDPSSGLVAVEFRHANPCDHHLAAGPFAGVMARHLRQAGFA